MASTPTQKKNLTSFETALKVAEHSFVGGQW